MKHRIKLAVTTLLITFAGLGLMVMQNWRDTSRTIVVNVPAPVVAAASAARPPLLTAVPATQPSAVLPIATDVPALQTPAISDDATVMHTAQPGETLSGLASGLRNKETKAYRDAIVNANPSLKADPDKLVAGKTYVIPAAADVPTAAAADVSNAVSTAKSGVDTSTATPAVDGAETAKSADATATASNAATPVESPASAAAATPTDPTKVLKYTAKPGDTLTNMAGAFLGSPTQANQDAITNANASLKADPNHLVAGQTYKIPVTDDGLSAAAVPVKTDARPAVQPDADQMVTPPAPKMLTYTARTGDTLTSMAAALLGSDSPAARELIINSNPSLKRDPDKVIAGQTYSIPAPVAELDQR